MDDKNSLESVCKSGKKKHFIKQYTTHLTYELISLILDTEKINRYFGALSSQVENIRFLRNEITCMNVLEVFVLLFIRETFERNCLFKKLFIQVY